jgi:multisubunit Na+/H+ antiporter MnhE subunit
VEEVQHLLLGQAKGQLSAGRVWRWIVYWFLWWVVLLGLWLLFVDTLAPAEVLVGLGAAALAALAALGIHAYGGTRFRFHVRWLLLLRDVPANTLRDCVTLGVVLWRHLIRGERARGAFRTIPFPIHDDPTAAAWRAFVAATTSVAPNTYVIRFDRERATVIVHQLVPDPPDRMESLLVGGAPDAPRGRG